MATSKAYNVVIELKNGDIEQICVMDIDLPYNILKIYDKRKIERMKVEIKNNRGNLVSYHIFYDRLANDKRESGKPIRIQYIDGVLEGYIDWVIDGLPYYTFAELGERRGHKIDISLIEKFLN